MKPIASALMFIAAACATPTSQSCPEVAGMVVEYQVNPAGALELFKPISFPTKEGCVPVSTAGMTDAWLKTACIMMALDEFAPTYGSSEAPRSMFTYYIFKPDRPNVVFRNMKSGSSAGNPVIYVEDDILQSIGNDKDGSAVCDRKIERPPLDNQMNPTSRPP